MSELEDIPQILGSLRGLFNAQYERAERLEAENKKLEQSLELALGEKQDVFLETLKDYCEKLDTTMILAMRKYGLEGCSVIPTCCGQAVVGEQKGEARMDSIEATLPGICMMYFVCGQMGQDAYHDYNYWTDGLVV